MDKLIWDDLLCELKVYVHDDAVVELYEPCFLCGTGKRIFINIKDLAEMLAKARTFMAGVVKV